MMELRIIKILLILLLLSSQIVWGMDNNPSSSNDSCVELDSKKERLVELIKTEPFNIVSSRNVGDEYFSWSLGNYIFKCGGEIGYDCELFFNKKKLMSNNLYRGDSSDAVVALSPYIYQSEKKGSPYAVILVEGEEERGSAWFYVVVLKNEKVINFYYIDRGRSGDLALTAEYLTLHPEADEMPINPVEYISIFIDGDQRIIFKLNEEYLHPKKRPDEIGSNKGFTCMERKLRR